MSGRKRPAVVASLPSSSPAQPKKRKVTISTVEKRKKESDKAINTTVWLACEKRDRNHVVSLKCSVCIQFADKIHSCRNFNPAFIEGSQNLRASSFKDHAATDMHKRAIILFHKSRSSDVAEYAPIARALSTLDPDTASKLKRKFEVAYLIYKEGLAFTKMYIYIYTQLGMKQCFTTQNKKFNCEYCITNAGDREFGISNGSSFQLGHTALAGYQIDGCFKLP